MTSQPEPESGHDAEVISQPSAQRHPFAEAFLDGVDAGIAGSTRLAMARFVAKPGEFHDVVEAAVARFSLHLPLGHIEQRQSERFEQLVPAIAGEAGIESIAAR